jgi:hypothetical protein
MALQFDIGSPRFRTPNGAQSDTPKARPLVGYGRGLFCVRCQSPSFIAAAASITR